MLREDKINSFFTWRMLYLCVSGLLMNIFFANIVRVLGLSLYLDNVGSVFVAALGGPLPGIIVGFLSNAVNAAGNPISLYYGFLTVIIAALAAFYSGRGLFRKWWGILLSALSFTFIGGTVGSVLTWWLFGGQISGISAPLGFFFEGKGVSPFLSQMLADTLYDFPDKLLTVLLVGALLHLCPEKFRAGFPLSYIYENGGHDAAEEQPNKYHHSIGTRLTRLAVTIVAVVGLFALVIGAGYYQKLLSVNSEMSARYASLRAAQLIDGDTVNDLMESGVETPAYLTTEKKLEDIYNEDVDFRYIYVYVIKPEGCYVLYDIDTDNKKGLPLGAFVEHDPDIYNRIDEFLSGGEVTSGKANASFGTLVSAYTPVYNSTGQTVAYACADISQQAYIQHFMIYIVEFGSLVFASLLVTILLMQRYVNHHVAEPIAETIRLTRALDKLNPEDRTESDVWKQRIPVRTDDELEELYQAVTDGVERVSNSVRSRLETEQKLLQTKELERINAELEAAVQEADRANLAKSDFLSRMSHDMRTPMNGILGITALLRDRTDPEEIRADVTQIEMSAKYLLSLINDTLDMSKIESGKMILHPAPISSEDLFSNVLTTAQLLAAQKGVRLATDFPKIPHGQWLPVVTDASRVEQVFINLVSNAVKFTPKGGAVTLRMETVSITDDAVTDRYYVSDTGIGMSAEFQKHLFEPFSQEGRANTAGESGTGLGLAIVKEIVDLMHGSIQVNSKENEGTTFTVELTYPRYAGEVEVKPVANADLSILKGKRILLCEDHPVNAQIATRLLEKQDMLVERAENGQVGVNLFEHSAPNYYDAILMDVRMPVMGGIAAAKAIRAMTDHDDSKTIPIIAMTANAFDDDRRETAASGMNAHLAKPVEPTLLYETLAANLNH